MVIFSICLLSAVAAGALAWSFRGGVKRRMDRDVAWLDEVRLKFSPDCTDSRKYVQIAYLFQVVVMLPVLNFAIPVPLLGIALWLGVWMLPQKIADVKWRKRLHKIEQQLPQTLLKFSALTGAGLSVADAMKQLADETPMPIQYEYRIMAREWEMGSDLNSCVESAASRLDMQSFRLFSSIVTMNNRLGGNLVRALEDLSESLSSLEEMRREVRAATSEGRMNVYGLLAGPPMMLLIITFMDPDAVKMFLSTLIGWAILGPALLLTLIGFLWAKRIANVRV